jgi:hypothetical protein
MIVSTAPECLGAFFMNVDQLFGAKKMLVNMVNINLSSLRGAQSATRQSMDCFAPFARTMGEAISLFHGFSKAENVGQHFLWR